MTMKRLVGPEGSLDAKIVIVGEAPGSTEESMGKPFVGTSGNLLEQCMHSVGIARSECYLTNVVKEKPAGNDIDPFYNRKGFSKAGMDYVHQLKEELSATKGNVIVAAGNTALAALCGKDSVSKWRGSVLECTLLPGRKVIPIIHPAAAIREYLFKWYITADLRRVRLNSTFPEIRRVKRNIIMRPSFVEAIAYLEQMAKEPRVSFDIEIVNQEVSCFAVAPSATEAMVIPLGHRPNGYTQNYWTEEEEIAIMRALNTLLNSSVSTIIGQNIMFDTSFITKKYGIITRAKLADTMIGHHVTYYDFPKGLDFICSIYADEPYYKDEGKIWKNPNVTDTEFWGYNGKDACVTFEAWAPIEKEMEAKKTRNTYEFTMELFDVLLYMQMRGIKADRSRLAEAKKLVEEKITNFQAELDKKSGGLNVNSPKQCQDYFYIKLGHKPYISRKTGSITTDDKAMTKLERKGVREATLVKEIRGLKKLAGTYLDIEFDSDSRLRCSYNAAGTTTGRLSSSQTIFGTGCLPPGAEVLSHIGWKNIEDVKEDDYIAQWEKSGTISFQHPIPFSTYFEGDLCEAKSEQFNISLTPEHRVISKKTGRKEWSVASAIETSKLAYRDIPVAGMYKGGRISIPYPRLFTAVLADGSYEFNKVRIMFKKERKIQRLLGLLKMYGIEFTEQKAREGYRRFAFNKPNEWPDNKSFGIWVMGLDSITANEIVDEARYWDSHSRGQSYQFFTSKKEQAEWFSILAHLTGRSTTTTVREQNEGSYSDTTMYCVNVKPRNKITLEPKHWTRKPYKGTVYCVTVPSSFFLVRYNGFISITGNTNFQNIPPEFKTFLVADKGYFLAEFDKRQAEWVETAFLSGDANMMEVVEKGLDAHVRTGELMYRALSEMIEKEAKIIGNSTDEAWIQEQRMKHCPEVFKFNPPINMSIRQAAKKSNHGFNYMLSPIGFADANQMPLDDAKRCHAGYHNAYPGLRQWYKRTEDELKTKNRTLETFFGRKRWFGDRWADDLIKAAIAYRPQSTVADLVNLALIAMYKDQRDYMAWVDILGQVHDSVLIQYPIDRIDEFGKAAVMIKKYLEPTITYGGRSHVIATDLKVGPDWGKAKVDKETGLWTGGMRDIKLTDNAVEVATQIKDFMTKLQR